MLLIYVNVFLVLPQRQQTLQLGFVMSPPVVYKLQIFDIMLHMVIGDVRSDKLIISNELLL